MNRNQTKQKTTLEIIKKNYPEDVLIKKLDLMVRSLSKLEQEVLTQRFGLNDGNPQSLKKVGQRLGLTQPAVQLIETRALSRLRKQFIFGYFNIQ